MPKEMLTVVDKPLIHHAVEEAARSGIEQFIFVTGRNKSAIEDHFDYSFELEQTLLERQKLNELAELRSWVPGPGQVAYTRQQQPLGLGHAVWCARDLVDGEPFAVILADDLVLADKPCLRQLMDVHEETGGNVVAVMEVPRQETRRYGVLDPINDDGRRAEVRGLVEKPDPAKAPSTLSIIGRYILMPDVFEHLGRQSPTAGGEIQLTDAMAKMIGAYPFHGVRFSGTRFDCGTKAGFLKANIAFALARPDLGEDMKRFLRTCL
jgi:UTP--glucose-1-phosphate uridylyltransferase